MFTGIVEEVGKIIEISGQGNYFKVGCGFDIEKIEIGSSICCDGICLTVSNKGFTPDNIRWFEANVSDETKRLTNISCEISPWKKGKEINLERSLKVGDELGGHIITGHIDGTAKLEEVIIGKNSHELKVSIPEELMRYLAKKGSVALNGTSLTINDVGDDWLTVNLIPHTNEITNWKSVEISQRLNLEVDILARYVAQILKSKG